MRLPREDKHGGAGGLSGGGTGEGCIKVHSRAPRDLLMEDVFDFIRYFLGINFMTVTNLIH